MYTYTLYYCYIFLYDSKLKYETNITKCEFKIHAFEVQLGTTNYF